MKKFFAKIHLWLSIPFGIVISVLCLTGAILVFETELKELTRPSLYKASQISGEPLSFPELMEAVGGQLPDTVTLTSIQIPSSPKDNYRFGVAGQGRMSVMVDPYSGEVKGEVRPYAKGEFFSLVRRLHRWFLFEMKREGISWGKIITGTSTLIFVFIILSGIVIWVPKTLAGLKRRFSIKRGAGKFRFWYDFHLSMGKTASLFLLIMALTGLTWSFDWYRTGFYKVFGIEATQSAPGAQSSGHGIGTQNHVRDASRRGRPTEQSATTDFAVWEKAAASVKELAPRCKSITVQAGKISVAINRMGNTRASDSYTFDESTGEITDVSYYKDQPRSAKIRGWIYAVHVGSWGGITTRIIYFITCLIGAALPITGYYIWIKKRWKKWHRKK